MLAPGGLVGGLRTDDVALLFPQVSDVVIDAGPRGLVRTRRRIQGEAALEERNATRNFFPTDCRAASKLVERHEIIQAYI